MTIGLIFLVIALICFIVGAAGFPVPQVNPVAMGLAFWVLSIIIGKG